MSVQGFIATSAMCVSLSTDAFAASVARSTRSPHRDLARSLGLGCIFGTTEGLMCLAGFLLALSIGQWVGIIDHWIALIVLAVIGIRMIREGMSVDDEDLAGPYQSSLRGTLMTAFGTSIDAAAVGTALALSGAHVSISLFIGLTSFVASTTGFLLGPMIGNRFGKRAEIGGGMVLILIGISIFWQHMTGQAI